MRDLGYGSVGQGFKGKSGQALSLDPLLYRRRNYVCMENYRDARYYVLELPKGGN